MAPTTEPDRSSKHLGWRLGGTPHFVFEIPPLVFEREFFIDNLLVRIHHIIEMIGWASLAPWEFESSALNPEP